jgi:trigger factor
MQVTLATTEGLGRKLTITVPSAKIEEAYNKQLGIASRKAKIDGFRPGKVPAKIIEERFGPSVRYEVVDKMIRETLPEAIKQENLEVAGPPSIESVKAEPQQDMEYEVMLEVFPAIELKSLEGKAVEKVESEIGEADIESVLNKVRQQHANWKEVDRAAKNDDQVTIDFEGFVDGEAFEGGKAESVPLVLGSKSMIPGFEDGLVGAKAGDDVELNVTFPEKYHAENLAGKAAVFKTKVHKVEEPELPELNEEFAEKMGVKEGGVEGLKADLKKHLEREVTNLVSAKNKESVFDALLEANAFDIPNTMVEQEMQAMHKQAHHNHGGKHEDHPLSEEEKKQLQEPATKRVRLALLVNEVIKTKELKADQDKVKALVESMAGGYDNPEEFTQWYFSDPQRMQQLEAMALEDMVIEELLKDADVTVKNLSYEEIIQA